MLITSYLIEATEVLDYSIVDYYVFTYDYFREVLDSSI